MFISYEEMTELMARKIKEINKIKWKTTIRYLIGWIMLPLSFLIPFIIWVEPQIIAMFLSTPKEETDTIIRVVAVIVIFVGVIYFIVFLVRTAGNFNRQYKRLIVKEMIKHLIENYQLPGKAPNEELKWWYDRTGKVSNFRMNSSGLFIIKEGDKVSGHDGIKAKIGLTKFFFSTLELYKRVHSSRQSERYKYKSKFKGILFMADFNKHFKGHTLLRDRHIRSFNHLKRYVWLRFNSVTTGKHLPRIKMENPAFNRYFATRTSNEIEARYILTSNFMEKLLTFRKKRRNAIDISFRHNYIGLALLSKKDFFNPSIFRRMKHGQVKEVYNDLTFFFSIIEELDLNTRIWSKE